MMRSTIGTLTLVLAVAMIFGGALGAAEDSTAAAVTFHQDIEPLFQHNCQGCHRPEGTSLGGMIAPMSLTTYEEVRPWVKSIARKVADKSMPPWFASEHTKGLFANERTLTAEEIAMVVSWASSGAPRGNPADAPPTPVWADNDGWFMGEPDLVIDLEEPFWIDDDLRDVNISLKAERLTRELLPEPRWIRAIEFRPGSTAVHHIIASKRAAAAERPGATGMIGGIAPGTEPFRLPEGTGRLLLPDTQIFFQMHYNKEPGEGTGLWDDSKMAIWFHDRDAKIERIATWDAIGNSGFEIPPSYERWAVGASKIFDYDTTIFGYLPHMHLRGAYAKYVAYYPDGSEEILLEVPEYDWNWQTNYEYKEPKVIPAGTRIEVSMEFTNTEERNALVDMDLNTKRAVRFGGPTSDEMMLGFMDFAEHKPIDMGAETPSSGG